MTREKVIAAAKKKAASYAKKEKYNDEQTKLYIDEEVKKALEKYDENPNNSNPDEGKNTTPSNPNEGKITEEKEYIVYTPVENYCGEVAGVQFAYGKAKVKESWILNWFIEKGYKVEEVK